MTSAESLRDILNKRGNDPKSLDLDKIYQTRKCDIEIIKNLLETSKITKNNDNYYFKYCGTCNTIQDLYKYFQYLTYGGFDLRYYKKGDVADWRNKDEVFKSSEQCYLKIMYGNFGLGNHFKQITRNNIDKKAIAEINEIERVIDNGILAEDAQMGVTTRRMYTNESCTLIQKILRTAELRSKNYTAEYKGINIVKIDTDNPEKCHLELDWAFQPVTHSHFDNE
jgi:hypothetical protein